MDKATFAGIVGVIGGILALLFYKGMAKNLRIWQNDNFNLKFGKKEERLHRIWLVIVGVIMLVYGILLLMDVIN